MMFCDFSLDLMKPIDHQFLWVVKSFIYVDLSSADVVSSLLPKPWYRDSYVLANTFGDDYIYDLIYDIDTEDCIEYEMFILAE